MTPTRICAAVAIAAAAALPAAAHAEPGGPPIGRTCHYVSQTDNTGMSQVGVIEGGPLVAPGSSISIRCSIHVGNSVHSGPAHVVATAGPADSVVVLAPEEMSYPAHEDIVATCTEATIDTVTWYWTGDDWSNDPGSPCVRPTTICCPPDLPPPPADLPSPLAEIVDYAYCLVSGGLCDAIVTLDRALCPVFATLSPGVPGLVDIDAEGDIVLLGEPFWDCPPYDLFDS